MDIIRWVFAVPFLLFGLIVGVGNWGVLIAVVLNFVRTKSQNKEDSFSLVTPFVGPFIILLGLLICPASWSNRLWWLMFVIDPQYILLALGFIGEIASGAISKGE